MATLSLCMIVKNEEDTISNCLDSVQGIFDEIIIVDTGSTDLTKEVLSNYSLQIFDYQWKEDFADARNYAFSKGTKDYLMWLDADDVILQNDKEKLMVLKQKLNGSVRQVLAPYNISFDDDGNPTFSYNRERIFLRQANFRWISPIHEIIPLEKDAIVADFAVTHHKIHPTEKGRNLRIFRKLLSEGQILDARQEFYYARELYFNQYYSEAIGQFEHFLTRSDAWNENLITASLNLSECYHLTGQTNKAKNTLYRSFIYDLPRGEICCAIGLLLLNENRLEESAYWYKAALESDKKRIKNSFIDQDSYDYIPAIQLCVCYDRLGMKEKANRYNELAAKFKPNSKAVEYNRQYFNRQ